MPYTGASNFFQFGNEISGLKNLASLLGISVPELTAKQQFKVDSLIAGLPIVGDFAYADESMRYLEDYLSNRNMDWSDILYPYRTARSLGTSSAGTGVSRGVNFVSSNIRRLYDDKDVPSRPRSRQADYGASYGREWRL